MFCPNCGSNIEEGDAVFCPDCGTKLPQVGQPTQAAQDSAATVNLGKQSPASSGAMDAAFQPKTGVQPDSGLPYGAAAPAAGTTAQMPQAAAQPVNVNANAAAPAAASKSRTPLIAGIGAAAAVVVVAVVVGALFFTGVIGGPKEHKVSFETAGGPSVAAAEVKEGDVLTSPSNPVREGYVFEGWYLDAGFTQPATFPLAVDKDTTLYAKWVEEQADGNGGGGNGGNGIGDNPTIIVVTPNGTASGNISDYYQGANKNAYNASNVVGLQVETKKGKTLSGSVSRDSSDCVIPDSSSRVYSMSELRAMHLSAAELCVAWNEPFAREGYYFLNSSLQNYFEQCSWYPGRLTARGSQPGISKAAKTNVERLQSIASESSAKQWRSLAEY